MVDLMVRHDPELVQVQDIQGRTSVAAAAIGTKQDYMRGGVILQFYQEREWGGSLTIANRVFFMHARNENW